MKRTLTLILALALAAVLVLSGCSSKSEYATENDASLDDGVVATVKDIKISQADYNFLYSMIFNEMSQYSQYYGEGWLTMPVNDEGTTMETYMKDSSINQLTQLAAATYLAEENEVDLDDIKDVVDKSKEDVVKNYGGKDGYMSFLKECRTTDKAIETYLERVEIYNRLCDKLTAEGGAAYIDMEDILKEFAGNYMTVQHVLISTQEQTNEDGSVTPAKSEAEAKAIADEVIQKVAAGEDFDKLIEEYDEDPGMEPGKFYTFTDGQMVAEFEEASKNLEVGEYTKEAVKTDYGYHIIKKYDIDTNDENFTNFKQQKADEKMNEIINKKLEDLKVKKEDKKLEEYSKEWNTELQKRLTDNMQNQQPSAE